jgi:hypothetical protein
MPIHTLVKAGDQDIPGELLGTVDGLKVVRVDGEVFYMVCGTLRPIRSRFILDVNIIKTDVDIQKMIEELKGYEKRYFEDYSLEIEILEESLKTES